jgi:O-antigen ligase
MSHISRTIGYQAAPALLPPIASGVGFYFAARLSITYLFFQSDPQMGTIVSLSLNMLALMGVAFCSFGPAAEQQSSPWRLGCFRWVAAFLGMGLFSLFWSETVSLVNAFAYWCSIAADVAMVLLLLRAAAVELAATQLMRGYVLGACLIACVMWGSPTMRDLRPGNDEFFSPNAIGFTCAFGIFFAQFLLLRSQVWRWPAIFLSISLLRSLSKTTIAAFTVSELFLLLTSKSIQRRTKVRIVSAACAVLAAFSGLFAAYYEVYTNAGNQAETLTGRVGIWAFILDRSLERPWLGHGFNSVWKVIPPFGPDQFEAWHAHNELLQQFYAYGVAGVVLLCGLYFSFFRQARRLKEPQYRSLFVSLILFIVVRGFADTERFDLSFPFWSITLLTLLFAAIEKKSEVLP